MLIVTEGLMELTITRGEKEKLGMNIKGGLGGEFLTAASGDAVEAKNCCRAAWFMLGELQ